MKCHLISIKRLPCCHVNVHIKEAVEAQWGICHNQKKLRELKEDFVSNQSLTGTLSMPRTKTKQKKTNQKKELSDWSEILKLTLSCQGLESIMFLKNSFKWLSSNYSATYQEVQVQIPLLLLNQTGEFIIVQSQDLWFLLTAEAHEVQQGRKLKEERAVCRNG